MDEGKYLVDELLSNNVGSSMKMTITNIIDDEKESIWKITGDCEYSITMDGTHWGTLDSHVTSYDKSVSNGISTVMYALMQIITGTEFLSDLAREIEKAEVSVKEE